MKLIADALVDLPFKLDFCARGPDVDPLTCRLNETDATLYFPPSMGEGTDGQGIFGEWAWWTGKTLRLVLEREIASADDVEALRAQSLATGNEILRRFLNACRWRLARPDVHPVPIDARALTLELLHDDGRREALPEPASAFFYQSLPASPPLETSVSAQTLDALAADVRAGQSPPLAEQLRLDAEALEMQGETERAKLVRGLMNTSQNPKEENMANKPIFIFTASTKAIDLNSIIQALRIAGYNNASFSPTNWTPEVGDCNISYEPSHNFVHLTETLAEGKGRNVMLLAYDDVIPNAVDTIIAAICAEVDGKVVPGY